MHTELMSTGAEELDKKLGMPSEGAAAFRKKVAYVHKYLRAVESITELIPHLASFPDLSLLSQSKPIVADVHKVVQNLAAYVTSLASDMKNVSQCAYHEIAWELDIETHFAGFSDFYHKGILAHMKEHVQTSLESGVSQPLLPVATLSIYTVILYVLLGR